MNVTDEATQIDSRHALRYTSRRAVKV